MSQAVRINDGFRTFIDDISGMVFQYHLVQNAEDYMSDDVHANIAINNVDGIDDPYNDAYTVLKSYTDQFGITIRTYNDGAFRKTTVE